MYILMVTIKIKPEHRSEFIEALLADALGSVENEPGCLRFDVLQDEQEFNTIHLYEVYRDQSALELHRQAPHFLLWRDTVENWYAEIPNRQLCTNIFPTDGNWR
jgi:autoinducer 2-degrading protein